MFKSILVPLTGEKSDYTALATARAAAAPFEAHIEALLVRADANQLAAQVATFDTGMPVVTPDLVTAIEEQNQTRAARARASFDHFRKEFDIPVVAEPPHPARVSTAWRDIEGEIVHRVTSCARYSDLVVFGRTSIYSELSTDGIGSVLVGCGRPVLISPSKARPSLVRKIAIAWKETAEAARAVSLAMPLLKKANELLIFVHPEGEGTERARQTGNALAKVLKWHGLEARVECVTGRHAGASSVLLEAEEAGAELLVMGGYGHSRAREFVFGGFTRQVLSEAVLPVFLAH